MSNRHTSRVTSDVAIPVGQAANLIKQMRQKYPGLPLAWNTVENHRPYGKEPALTCPTNGQVFCCLVIIPNEGDDDDCLEYGPDFSRLTHL